MCYFHATSDTDGCFRIIKFFILFELGGRKGRDEKLNSSVVYVCDFSGTNCNGKAKWCTRKEYLPVTAIF